MWGRRLISAICAAAALWSGAAVASSAPQTSLRPVARAEVTFEARWDHRPSGKSWSLAALRGLRAHARNLPDIVPRDIAAWCPAYPTQARPAREAFWVGLLSALAKHESTYRPKAVGGGGLWYGLVQIYPDTARRYGCRAETGDDLKNGAANLSCALRIMSVTVARDRVVSAGMRGVAADWGPFHSEPKRTDMMQWTRAQPFCSGLGRSLRPVARPELPTSLATSD